MARWLRPEDFPEMDPAEAGDLIEQVESLAIVTAPCLARLSASGEFYEVQVAALRSILRGVLVRWRDRAEGGSADAVTLSAGPFAQTVTPQSKRNNIWPSELTDLQKVCSLGDSTAGKAWSVDRVGVVGDEHDGICSRWFGADHCSCMAEINPDHTALYPAHASHRAHLL